MSYSDGTPELRDVAHLIFNRLNGPGHTVEVLKLQKLLYYCNAWSITLRKSPLFSDAIQAWKHGPVVASIYAYHRGKIVLEDPIPEGDKDRLSQLDTEFINSVLDAYAPLSGWALRNRTHLEDPWIKAWEASEHGAIHGVEISHDSIQEYYGGVSVPLPLKKYDRRTSA